MLFLIVDDSRAMRMIVRNALRAAGYGACDVVEAGGGREAIAAARSRHPNVILCDWNMPEVDGMQVLMQLEKDGFPGVFGFVTSAVTAELRAGAAQHGADFVLAKPFNPVSFRDALEAVGVAPTGAMEAAASATPGFGRELTEQAVQGALDGLIRRPVTVRAAKWVGGASGRNLVAAEYVDRQGHPVAAVVCELPLATWLGAALTLVPVQIANQAIRSGKPDDGIFENYSEVLNCLTPNFSTEGRSAVLGPLTREPALPRSIRMVWSRGQSLEVVVDIGGYGRGRMALLTAA